MECGRESGFLQGSRPTQSEKQRVGGGWKHQRPWVLGPVGSFLPCELLLKPL